MTDSQSNRLDMYIIVNNFYLANQPDIDAVPARTTAFGQLQSNIVAINKQIGSQSTNTSGVAQDKTALRDTLDNMTNSVLQPCKAWAIAIGNNTLAAEFDYPISEIQKIKDDIMQGFCEYRIGLVSANLVAMADYGIDPTIVTSWQDALNVYVAVLESPREAVNARHLHTETLKDLISQTQELLTQQLDPLMIPFRSTNPELYNAYKQARIIINRKGSSGKPITPKPNSIYISGNVSDLNTLAPIENATVSAKSSGTAAFITTTTNADGNFKLELTDIPDNGIFIGTLEASATEYYPESVAVELGAGKTYTYDFKLNLIVIP
ncbi:MAG: carboxypeptidase-like regulatory domain-containing protein [Flavobacteriales bacterium]|nr:carboxypeptidase-like regulatory domain-containing protein [Flavobacteriales bacterium]